MHFQRALRTRARTGVGHYAVVELSSVDEKRKTFITKNTAYEA